MTPVEAYDGRRAACDGDSCQITYPDDMRKMLKGLSGQQRSKLRRWLGMEPMDYDAPGSTVREQGV